MRLGLIADTHGYLGDDAIAALRGCDRILHAGDVGEGVLAPLESLAPIIAVRGNNDLTGEAAALPMLATIDTPAGPLTLVHRLVDAPPEGWNLLVFGHCHRRHAYTDAGGRTLANPGAAGRRGFHRERSLALLSFDGAAPVVEFIALTPRKDAR